MRKELPKVYEPGDVESRIYQMWMDNDCFKAEPNPNKKPFSIVMPPPNVTGQLHMGHALDCTLQDILTRFKRMQGYEALWLPGSDHAGIATQIKVEENLRKEEGLTRYDLGREKFLERVWAWKEKYGNRIVEQQKKMGASCDWSRDRFTMDEGCSRAVRETFCELYDKGLIYKGSRIINWCPHCMTALSDAEVEYTDKPGHLWYVRYPLTDGSGDIIIATTRPETMMGDTGVAVNPEDEKFKHLIGKTCILPIMNREIPIVGDEYCEIGFGTGAVKMTPAHDPNDFEVGLRHNLEVICVISDDGTINENGGRYEGMDRYECRKAIVADLEAEGYLVKTEDYSHNVGTCYRCHNDVEPLISAQWFVKMAPLAKEAIRVVEDGTIQFVPERFTKTYINWMENVHDWCISRQLWWGHQIPAWYCDECGHINVSRQDPTKCEKCGCTHLTREEDVLDTWFSSQLWTFATQGWPDHPDELVGHHPTKVLVTARDIIALWVARMIMSSLYFIGEIPFEDVFIYATILAKDGSRMSKSKGNGVDPMDLIAMYGADAMRFNLLTLVTNNQDVKFDANIDKKTHELVDSPRTEAARSFVTKIWNAARFVMLNMDGYEPGEPQAATAADAWILSRLAKLTASVTAGIEEYRFGDVARELYAFFWNEFCDWYIELCKARLSQDGETRLVAQRNLVFVLDSALRLLHPVMPFVTEAIWEYLPVEDDAPALMVAAWPDAGDLSCWIDDEAEQAIQLVVQLVTSVRATRAAYGISPRQELAVTLRFADDDEDALAKRALVERQRDLIMALAKLSSLDIIEADAPRPAECGIDFVGDIEVYVGLSGLVDFAEERKRLEGRRAKALKELEKLDKKLGNQNFLDKAAPEAVEKVRTEHAELTQELKLIKAQLEE